MSSRVRSRHGGLTADTSCVLVVETKLAFALRCGMRELFWCRSSALLNIGVVRLPVSHRLIRAWQVGQAAELVNMKAPPSDRPNL